MSASLIQDLAKPWKLLYRCRRFRVRKIWLVRTEDRRRAYTIEIFIWLEIQANFMNRVRLYTFLLYALTVHKKSRRAGIPPCSIAVKFLAGTSVSVQLENGEPGETEILQSCRRPGMSRSATDNARNCMAGNWKADKQGCLRENQVKCTCERTFP